VPQVKIVRWRMGLVGMSAEVMQFMPLRKAEVDPASNVADVALSHRPDWERRR